MVSSKDNSRDSSKTQKNKPQKKQDKEQKKNTKVWEQKCGLNECPPNSGLPTGSDKDQNTSENQTETVTEPHDS